MSSSNSNARPTRNRLGQAISSALVLAIVAPHVSADSLAVATGVTSEEASAARKAEYAKRLPDLGSDTPASRSAQNDRLLGEALAFLATGASTDELTGRAANAALEAGTDALRASGIPFLGSLQGGVVYNATLGHLDFDLLSMLKLSGDGTGSHWLLQLGAHNLRDRTTANAGLVYRWLDPDGRYLLGSSLFYDHDFDGGAKRVGAGVEVANDTVRGFANTYAPLGGWVNSPDDADLEERAARGFDVGLAWTPRELSMLDLQFKGAKWLGDAVDVFGSGTTEMDPTVWSAKATLTPVPALRVGLEHSQVAGGQKDLQAMLSWVYQFGVPLSQQWAPTQGGERNDLRLRALSPVEREKRIVVDTRDKFSTPAFANGAVATSVIEGQTFTHALTVAGGTLPLAFSLSGPDAARFTLSGAGLTLPAQQFDTPADVGADNTYNVTVLAVDARGQQATQQLAISVQSAAPAARNARIEGEAQVGSALTLGYDYFSALGEAEDTAARSIQWFRRGAQAQGDVDIEGATGAQYIPVAEDEGYSIGARITVQSTGGRIGLAVEAVSDVVKAAQGAGDNAPTASPSLQGNVAIGSTLTGLVGYSDADGDAEGTHLYRWYRATNAAGSDAVGIVAASSARYTITAADAGHYLVFEVTPRSATGTPDVGAPVRIVTTIAVPATTQGTAPTATPSLQGTAKVGQTLTGLVGYADAENDPEGTHEYRWYRATDAAGANRALIADASGPSYTADVADVGHYLVFEVIPHSASNLPNVGVAARVASALVADYALPTANPTISLAGARVVGNAVLNAAAGYASEEGDGEGAHLYQWYRADDAKGTGRIAIAAATSATYTPIAADQGKHLSVEVTPKSANGVMGAATRSNDTVAIPYGEWRYQKFGNANYVGALREVVVTGRSGTARRVRIEIGRAEEANNSSSYAVTGQVIAPGQAVNVLFTDLANGETRAVEREWSSLPSGGNGTWEIWVHQPNIIELNDLGGINYATVDFLDDEA